MANLTLSEGGSIITTKFVMPNNGNRNSAAFIAFLKKKKKKNQVEKSKDIRQDCKLDIFCRWICMHPHENVQDLAETTPP